MAEKRDGLQRRGRQLEERCKVFLVRIGNLANNQAGKQPSCMTCDLAMFANCGDVGARTAPNSHFLHSCYGSGPMRREGGRQRRAEVEVESGR